MAILKNRRASSVCVKSLPPSAGSKITVTFAASGTVDGADPDVTQARVAEGNAAQSALRHSLIRFRLAAIQNVNQVALVAGKSAATIFKPYRELVRPPE